MFSFIHAQAPHSPWVFFPSGARYRNMPRPIVPDTRPNRWVDDDWPVRLTRSRHLLQVQYADRLVGELMARLRDTGMYDETLLVVTSDHGISFRPGGPLRAFTIQNLHEVASVPLFVWSLTGARKERPRKVDTRIDADEAPTTHVGTIAVRYAAQRSGQVAGLVLIDGAYPIAMFDEAGNLDMRLSWDHRVYDGGTACRALADMEAILLGDILNEVQGRNLRAAA